MSHRIEVDRDTSKAYCNYVVAFTESTTFESVRAAHLTDYEYADLQPYSMENLGAENVSHGSGGIRKKACERA